MGSNRGFEVFDSMTNGIRAGVKLLYNYRTIYGLNTLNTIMNRFAPTSENNTDAYISFLEKKTNIKRNEMFDIGQITDIAKWICVYESGYNVDYSVFSVQLNKLQNV